MRATRGEECNLVPLKNGQCNCATNWAKHLCCLVDQKQDANVYLHS